VSNETYTCQKTYRRPTTDRVFPATICHILQHSLLNTVHILSLGCNALQHTATHSTQKRCTYRSFPASLQYTATHCSTQQQQHPTAHNNTPKHTQLKDGAQPYVFSATHCKTETQRNTFYSNTVHIPIFPATHCDTLQHTVAHSITPQHTLPATHSTVRWCTYQSLLQHTATNCNAHTVPHYNTLLKDGAHTESSLQHTTTHCNTLQHTTTHSTQRWNTYQVFPATHCSTLQHTATHSTQRWYTYRVIPATYYSTLQHTATHCNTLYSKMVHVRSLLQRLLEPRLYPRRRWKVAALRRIVLWERVMAHV